MRLSEANVVEIILNDIRGIDYSHPPKAQSVLIVLIFWNWYCDYQRNLSDPSVLITPADYVLDMIINLMIWVCRQLVRHLSMAIAQCNIDCLVQKKYQNILLFPASIGANITGFCGRCGCTGRTCRDACRDHWIAVSSEVGGWEHSGAFATRSFAFLVRGRCGRWRWWPYCTHSTITWPNEDDTIFGISQCQ